jgi:endoglycosylceramidase
MNAESGVRAGRGPIAIGLVVLVAALAWAAGGSAQADAGATPSFDGPLHQDGRVFRDPEGRVVVMHGLMAVWKEAPYYPVAADDPDDSHVPVFTEGDADLIQQMGVDAIRLAWYWEGLEPTEGTFDTGYRDGMLAVESKLADRNIYTVLDSHQDQYDTLFGDKPGFPNWTADYDGLEIAPDPSDPGYVGWVFPLGYLHASTQRAFGHLYENDYDLWAKYGAAWQYMAQAFENRPMVVGYDLMNEPWPTQHPDGDPQYDTSGCLTEGCPAWDRHVMQPLMDSLARSIRAVDSERTVFYEPTLAFNSGRPNGFGPPPSDAGPVGLSFHDQCSTRAQYKVTHDESLVEKGHTICPPEEATTMHNADDTSAALGGPPLMTEVAPTTDRDVEGINCLFERADYFQTGFTYGLGWSSRNHGLRDLAEESEPDGESPFKLMALARVYPRAIAGDPDHYAFDIRTGRFELDYDVDPDDPIAAPTVISVPTAIQYSNGYDVAVEGGTVTSADDADLLTVQNDPGAARVRVVVTAAAGDTMLRPGFPPCVMDPTDPLSTTVALDGGSRRAALRGGLPATVDCSRACDLEATLRMRKKIARHLGLKPEHRGERFVTVAATSTSGPAGEPTSIRVPFKAKAKRALLSRHRLRGQLRVSATFGHAANPGEPVQRLLPVRYRPRNR